MSSSSIFGLNSIISNIEDILDALRAYVPGLRSESSGFNDEEAPPLPTHDRMMEVDRWVQNTLPRASSIPSILEVVKFQRQMIFATTDFRFNFFDNSNIENVSIYTFSDDFNTILELTESIDKVKSVRVVQTTLKKQEFLGNIVDHC